MTQDCLSENSVSCFFLNRSSYYYSAVEEKAEVREIAKREKLAVSEKRDSTGICCIGKHNFRTFLSDSIQYSPGDFRLIDRTKVGTHQGVAYYTTGQRKGLGIGGPGEAYFVVDKDVVPYLNLMLVAIAI